SSPCPAERLRDHIDSGSPVQSPCVTLLTMISDPLARPSPRHHEDREWHTFSSAVGIADRDAVRELTIRARGLIQGNAEDHEDELRLDNRRWPDGDDWRRAWRRDRVEAYLDGPRKPITRDDHHHRRFLCLLGHLDRIRHDRGDIKRSNGNNLGRRDVL